jgi:hypothetical protein
VLFGAIWCCIVKIFQDDIIGVVGVVGFGTTAERWELRLIGMENPEDKKEARGEDW